MEVLQQEKVKCFGIGNALKGPFGLGRGVDVIVFNDEKGMPQKVACPFAIDALGAVFCAANHPEAIQAYQDGKDGSLSEVSTCFRVHPRGK